MKQLETQVCINTSLRFFKNFKYSNVLLMFFIQTINSDVISLMMCNLKNLISYIQFFEKFQIS